MEQGDVLGGRYELRKRRGRGGMADVWEAMDLRDKRLVAVKCLRLDGYSPEDDDAHAKVREMRGRFRREGALLGRLNHRGIPVLYDQGVHHGDPYIVMRLVEGLPLHRFLDRYTPTIAVAAAIGVQIADALACAHELPVVHRDLKPYNLIIDENGVVVLIDFGVAKPLWPGVTDYTRHGSTVGSRGYEAPEQILERHVTPRTDLYALGCVLYHLVTGHPPFSGERLRDQHVHDSPVPPSYYVEHIPVSLEALILGLLEKEPENRPVDAETVREVLRGYAPKLGDSAPSPRLDPDPTRPLRMPDEYEVPAVVGVPEVVSPANGTRRNAAFLSRREFRDLCGRVRSEFDVDEPGGVLDRLVELLPAARRDWGQSDRQVRDAHRVAADALRVAGRYNQALALYENLTLSLHGGDGSDDRADYLEGVLGAAECRVPFGELLPAMEALTMVVHALSELTGERALVLEGRCREVGIELKELGFDERVATLLPGLGED